MIRNQLRKRILIKKWLRLIKELEKLGRSIVVEADSTKRPSDPETVAKLLLVRTISHAETGNSRADQGQRAVYRFLWLLS
jgi:hypothetical protein